MVIKVLGPGCKNCTALTENTKAALRETGIDAEVVKVQDFKGYSCIWHHVHPWSGYR